MNGAIVVQTISLAAVSMVPISSVIPHGSRYTIGERKLEKRLPEKSGLRERIMTESQDYGERDAIIMKRDFRSWYKSVQHMINSFNSTLT